MAVAIEIVFPAVKEAAASAMDELKSDGGRALSALPAVVGHENVLDDVPVAEFDDVFVTVVAVVVGVPESPIQRADSRAALGGRWLPGRGVERAVKMIRGVIRIRAPEIPIV